MNTEFAAIRSSLTAGQALEKLKSELKKKESVYYIYVLDDNDSLVGVVTMRLLLLAPPEKPVAELMRKRIAKVRVDADVKDVARQFLKYDFTVIPVVDKQNKLLGIITIKDAFESVYPKIREEVEEVK